MPRFDLVEQVAPDYPELPTPLRRRRRRLGRERLQLAFECPAVREWHREPERHIVQPCLSPQNRFARNS
jgi:hypothetical protein